MLQVLGLGIEVWKHLLRHEKDNTFVYVFFPLLCSPTLHILGDCQAQTTTVPPPFSHSAGPEWGKAIWLPDHLYSALSGNGFSDSDLFFVSMLFVSIVKTQGKRETERGGEKKNKFDRSPVNYLPGV